MLLVIVDAHSKWIEVCVGKSSTAEVTVRHLQRVLAIYGIPKIVVTDNGSCFVSEIIEDFCHRNGVRHAKVALYPSSNGLAERAVQTIKQALSHKPKGMLTADHLARFLLTYRITPHPTTGQAPSQLLMGRRLTSKFDLLYPRAERQVDAAQERQARAHNQTAKERQGCEPGNTVYVRAHNNIHPCVASKFEEVRNRRLCACNHASVIQR